MTDKWTVLGDREISTFEPFGLMGIVNATPDSFFDGGQYADVKDLSTHARQLVHDGADILDLGAASSRPGAKPVAPEEEQRRLEPLLAELGQQDKPYFLSVDTFSADVAAWALSQNVDIINDISACNWDAGLLDVLVQYKPGYILMHSQGRPDVMQNNPHYSNVRKEVCTFFEKKLNQLVRAGLPEQRIVLDPGIGFGKTVQNNLELLAHPEDWLAFGRPILVGLSMKSLFADLFGLAKDKRGSVTQVATVLLWQKGIFWHRVHDVAGVRQSLILARILNKETGQGE